MTNEKVKILHLEDITPDAEMVERELRKSNLQFDYSLVNSKEDYLNGLEKFQPDIVLCGHVLSLFCSIEALQILKDRKLAIPFILISAVITDDFAIHFSGGGADDYILKDGLQRLPIAIRNLIEKSFLKREQQNYLKKLEENEKRYKALLENSNDVVIIFDPEGKVTYTTQNVTRILGYTIEEMLGLNIMSLAPPEDVIPIREVLEKLLANPGVAMKGHTGRLLHKNGTYRWMESTATNLLRDSAINGIVNNFRDITEKKLAEQVLIDSEEKYRSIFMNNVDGLLLTVADGDILAANPAACQMFQMTEEEICAAGRFGLIDTSDPRLAAGLKERQEKGKASTEITFIRKNGEKFPGEITSAIFSDGQGIKRASIIVRDITKRKETEQKLLNTTAALRQALKDVNRILNSSVDLICTCDREGIFKIVNAASFGILGYHPLEMIGKSYLNFINEGDIDYTRKLIKKIIKGIPVTIFENSYFHKNGNLVPIIWSARWDDEDQLYYCIGKDGTEKKKLEQAFQHERDRFYELFQFAPASLVIFKGPEHVFEMANDPYLTIAHRSDIVGKTVREVFPEIENQGLFEMLDTVYKTGKPIVANERLIQVYKSNSGKLVDVYMNFVFQPYKNTNNEIEGVFFFANDVTEQVQSRKKIEQSEKKFRQIVETAQEGIWTLDEFGRTVFVNQKMCEMLEYSQDEILGKYTYDFKDEAGKQETLKRLPARELRQIEKHESRFITKSGKSLYTIVSTNPLFNEQGKYEGILGMVNNITERKEQEIQIRKNAEERELLIAELNRSIKDLKQFSFITSHNFRAPLANLIGLLGLIDYNTLTEANKEVIQMFKAATQQLNKTINHLVQILIIKDNVNVNVTKNNIREIVNGVVNSFIFDVNENNCTIYFEMDVEYIWFNKAYLESILINLVSNAIKFRSPKRPLQIEIITRRKENNEILLMVKDNGIGIDLKMHRKSIFGLYQKFHSNSDSTGLGLFVVKSQIEVLGGTIDVESEVDKGTTFILTFKELSYRKQSS